MRAVVLFGSNADKKYAIIEEAVTLLANRVGKVVVFSSYYNTEPWGFDSTEWFLNKAVAYDTTLSPEALLAVCAETEKQLGRVRPAGAMRYTSRPIDIDILFYDAVVINTPALTIPHPRIAERRFVLIPLCEIMPDFEHPVYRRTIRKLLAECTDPLHVHIVSTFN